MLVWHERLLYGESQQGQSAVQLADRISRLGTGLRNLLLTRKP